jgi:hypothetical protein
MSFDAAIVNSVLVIETTEPETTTTTTPPTDELRPGLDPTDISPGLIGFVVTFLVAAAAVLLFLSMSGKLRKVSHKGHATNRVTGTFDGPGPKRNGAHAEPGLTPIADSPTSSDAAPSADSGSDSSDSGSND